MDIKFDNLVPLLEKLNKDNDNKNINATPKITQQATYNSNSDSKEKDDKEQKTSTQGNYDSFGNIDDLQKKVCMIRKLKNSMNGNPIDMIDILNQNSNPEMKSALTIFRTMPAIMRALGNDEDEKNDGDNFCKEDNKTNDDLFDNQVVKTKSVDSDSPNKKPAEPVSQNIHFDFTNINNNHNNNANQNLTNLKQDKPGIFTNFRQN